MSDPIIDHVRKLREENASLKEENKKLKAELFRLKEDKAENEATYERVIASYKTKLDAIYANKKMLDEQEKIYDGVISNLK